MPGATAETVLIVDDNRDAADTLAVALQGYGHNVAVAYSAREALDLLDENPGIGLVVSDIRMPDVSGFDFRRVVRHRFPKLPMVLITGIPVTSDDVIPRDTAILQKPVAASDLQQVILDLQNRATGDESTR
ncbi:MAG TPA: response regulator [Casimicrobiaceae bacterium]|jgi:DNA-binding NtrC family response regulator